MRTVFFLVATFINAGSDTVSNATLDFYSLSSDCSVQSLCETITFEQLLPAQSAEFKQNWAGLEGTYNLLCILDQSNQIEEADETNNRDSLKISLLTGVPYVWQEINGYCHYASQSMLFNHCGYSHTVMQTVEFSSAPYSYIYFDNLFQGISGIFSSQSVSDIRWAGEMRNLTNQYYKFWTWSAYWMHLQEELDKGTPIEVGVDPYYLPQPDYEICRTYGIHSGHAVVVVGITEDQVILHDPGVGIGLW